MSNDDTHEIVLTGLDGSNPLAFLAALGTLRSLTLVWPHSEVKMAWRQERSAWRPLIQSITASDNDMVAALHEQCRIARNHPTLSIADNLAIDVKIFREHLCEQAESPNSEATAFAAAFGCDAICDDENVICDTSLRTMSGAGHQHFLKTMRDVLQGVTKEQIHKALFHPWRYDDPLKGLSLRFDPMDEKRYALRWDDPSSDPTRSRCGNVLGANALAILGIPFLVVAPVRCELHTTGFRGQLSRDCYWSWPIWNTFLSCDTIASALTLAQLKDDKVPRSQLMQRGITEVYRSQRITTGKFRNFTPAQPV